MRNCIDDGTLQSWFDDELDASAAASVTAHLHTCRACAEAASAIEAENVILSEGLAAEFTAAIPTERLRRRLDDAVAQLHVAAPRAVNRYWWSSLGDLVPSFRVAAYASAAAAILLAGWLALVYVKRDQPVPLVSIGGGLPEIALVTPRADQVVDPVRTKPSDALPRPVTRSIKRTPRVEERSTSLAWQERQYEQAIAKLDEALKAQAPLRPSLRVEYEYNLAVIDNAITTTRGVARKNPNDPQATQFMLAAYQSKIDLMNQIADARIMEK